MLLAASAGTLIAGSAHAQSSVQLYGLTDLSFPTYRTHADANGNHVIGMGNDGEPWFSGSRWGLKGAEDIGGGSEVLFPPAGGIVGADEQMGDTRQIVD